MQRWLHLYQGSEFALIICQEVVAVLALLDEGVKTTNADVCNS